MYPGVLLKVSMAVISFFAIFGFVKVIRYMLVFIIILAAVFAFMGVIILIGKGDNLIAGYNMASKREREQYNIKRLRGLIGGLLLLLAPMMFMLAGEPSLGQAFGFSGLVFILCIVVVILANTWAKKK